jgi:hypothetical protein
MLWVCPDVSEELAAFISTVTEFSSRKPIHQDNTKVCNNLEDHLFNIRGTVHRSVTELHLVGDLLLV